MGGLNATYSNHGLVTVVTKEQFTYGRGLLSAQTERFTTGLSLPNYLIASWLPTFSVRQNMPEVASGFNADARAQ